MKNKMAAMYRMMLSFDPAEGGSGTAVADPPAATGGAGGGGTDGGGSGFFTNLSKREMPADVKPDAAPVSETKPPIPGEQSADKTAELEKMAADALAASSGGKTPEQLAAEAAAQAAAGKTGEVEITPETVFKTPIFGRFKTPREVEAAFLRAQQEDQRLARENKNLRADSEKALATRESELAAVRAELKMVRETPPFKELTKEEYAELAKESPEQAIEYRFEKEKHDKAVQSARESGAREVQARKERNEAIGAEIQRSYLEMSSDKKKYPMFKEVEPMMEKIHVLLGGDKSPLRNDPKAVFIYYRMAIGELYAGLLAKGGVARTEAAEAAKKAAEAAARATGAAGGGTGGTGGPAKGDPAYDAWSKAIDAEAPKKLLSFGD